MQMVVTQTQARKINWKKFACFSEIIKNLWKWKSQVYSESDFYRRWVCLTKETSPTRANKFRNFENRVGFLSGYDIPDISSHKKHPEGKKARPRSSGFWDFRDFFELLKFRSRSPGFRDFFRYFQIPIPGISGFSGIFDLAQNWKSLSRIPKKSHPEANSALRRSVVNCD